MLSLESVVRQAQRPKMRIGSALVETHTHTHTHTKRETVQLSGKALVKTKINLLTLNKYECIDTF